MWIIGHTVLAYLVIKTIALVQKRELEPRQIFYLFIFANILDGLHFGPLKLLTHCLIGAVLFPVFWIIVFRKLAIIGRKDGPLLLLAALLHVVGDLSFSVFHPFFPLNSDSFSLYSWNSFEDMVAEFVLAIIFFVVFFCSGDFGRLNSYLLQEKKNFFRQLGKTKIYDTRLFTFYLFLLFCAFVWGQFIYSVILNHHRLAAGMWYYWSFTLTFAVFGYCLSRPLMETCRES